MSMIRPRVVVSECLGFAAVRYNGQILESRFVEALRDHVEFVQVCPEVGIGLGVPRDPIRIEVRDGGSAGGEGEDGAAPSGSPGPEGGAASGGVGPEQELRLVQPSTGLDLTREMASFADSFLEGVGSVDGFILKTKSPSCAVVDAKRFPEDGDAPLGERGPGLFAAEVLERFPHAAIQDEGRLTNYRLRHRFLAHLYAAARLREAREAGTMEALVRFHTGHKLLLMACGEAVMREMGRVVANHEGRPADEVFDAYTHGFSRAMAGPARTGPHVNVLQHAFGYVSGRLDEGERRSFLDRLEEYGRGRLPLTALLTLLRGWVVRFEEPYLAVQRYFEPYPAALMDLSDSKGGGR